MNKKCTKCLLELPLESFGNSKNYSDGKNYWCKNCFSEYKKNRPVKKRIISKEQNKRNYESHKEKRLESFRKYYKSNTDRIKKSQKEWRKNNRESILLRNRARKKKISSGKISQAEINILKDKFKTICFYCESEENIQLDHYIPLSKGGEHSLDNLVTACKACNLSKSNKMPEKWKKFFQKKA